MNEIHTLCQQFIADRDCLKANFKWESMYLYPVCAAIFIQNGVKADSTRLVQAKDLLNAKTGVFSNFRSTARLAMVSMLAADDDPEGLLVRALEVYDALKGQFMTTAYLPAAAMAAAQVSEPLRDAELAVRTKDIYRKMRKEHPFLTSGEDVVFCLLMALSGRDDDVLLTECERCYDLLKQEFSIGNTVQTLSHVLTLCDGVPEEKCRRAVELYHLLYDRGLKYGKSYELGTLGVPAMTGAPLDTIADEIAEADAYLSECPGYRGIFGAAKRQRLMHASLIVSGKYTSALGKTAATAASVTGTVALILAQQAAIAASVAATAAASSANS